MIRHLVGALQHADILVGVVAAHRAHDRRNHRGEVNRLAVRAGSLHSGAAAKDQAVRPAPTSSHDAVRAAVLLRNGCVSLRQRNRARGTNRRLVFGLRNFHGGRFSSRLHLGLNGGPHGGVLVRLGSLSFSPIRRGLRRLHLGALIRRGDLSIGIHSRYCTHSRLLQAHDNPPHARVPHR